MLQTLSKLANHLAEIWRKLGINQRITIAATTIGVIAGLTAIGYWSNRADYALLYGRLDEAETGRVVAAIEDTGVLYRIGDSGRSVYVPSDKVHLVRMQLASKGIPKGEGVGFEIFDKANFGISDFVQRANYLRAIQGELARTISQLDDVEASRVMIVMPENRLLVDEQRKPTASVFVRVSGTSPLPTPSVNAIRFLVANSVEGLQANNVSVVDNRGNVLSSNDESDSIAGLTSNQLGARQQIEQYLSQKAQTMLEKVLGPGQAVVRVAVDINTDTINQTEESFDPDVQVARSTTSTEESNESTTANNSGVVGLTANVSTNQQANVASNTNRNRKKITNNQYEINKTVRNILQAPGSLDRISAAVFIASKSEGVGEERKIVPRAPEEIEKLKKVVQSALGIQLTNNDIRSDEITLEEMPFNQELSIELTQQLDQQNQHAFWWEIAKNSGFALLALGIFFFFIRSIKKAPIETIPMGVPVGELVIGPDGKRQQKTKEEVTPSEVLNKLIIENPENATHAVRSWLGHIGNN